MTTNEKKEETKKVYNYDDIIISLENCILPSEKLDETPSMKDGLDRDTENDLRFYGCELIQISGLLLKLPQVAMATGQILLQRFYFSKSMIKHDVEVYAMASIFLAAKIEESPRRLRDIVNVCHHIKQKVQQKTITPMDYFSNQYFNTKNAIIKAERQILKDLGFCVHVKHPHKLIITYLQMLDAEKNVLLATKAWNYMNDSLRTDVFVRFKPEVIACACIFLAARVVKINLPLRPPWWELFDATYDDIEDISLSILRLYSRPRRKTSHLEAAVAKAKKALQEKKESLASQNPSPAGSFTPSHNSNQSNTVNNESTKTSSKTNSPNAPQEKKNALSSVITSKKGDIEPSSNDRKNHNHSNSRNAHSDTSESSESEEELPSKKYDQQRRQYEKEKRRSESSESDDNRRPKPSKIHRSDNSPKDYRRERTKDYERNRYKEKGHRNNDINLKYDRRRSRSRSPGVKRRVPSPTRKERYQKEKERIKSKDKYYDKYMDKYSEKHSDKYLEKYKIRR